MPPMRQMRPMRRCDPIRGLVLVAQAEPLVRLLRIGGDALAVGRQPIPDRLDFTDAGLAGKPPEDATSARARAGWLESKRARRVGIGLSKHRLLGRLQAAKRIDPFVRPPEPTADCGADEDRQERVGAIGQGRGGVVAELAPVRVCERRRGAASRQRLKGRHQATLRERVHRKQLGRDQVEVARAGMIRDAAGGGEKAFVESRCGTDAIQRFVGRLAIVALARLLEQVKPRHAIAVVEAGPLPDVEQRAAALRRHELASLHREGVDAGIVRGSGLLGKPLEQSRGRRRVGSRLAIRSSAAGGARNAAVLARSAVQLEKVARSRVPSSPSRRIESSTVRWLASTPRSASTAATSHAPELSVSTQPTPQTSTSSLPLG